MFKVGKTSIVFSNIILCISAVMIGPILAIIFLYRSIFEI